MKNNRPIFRYHLIVALIAMIFPKYSTNQVGFVMLFALCVQMFSIGLGALYFKTRKIRRLKLDVVVSCLIIFVVTNFITNRFGLLQFIITNLGHQEIFPNLSQSIIRLSMSFFAGGLQYYFSDENEDEISEKVTKGFIFLSFCFVAFFLVNNIFNKLKNQRVSAPESWVNEDKRNDSYTTAIGIAFKYSHPDDWIESYYYDPEIGKEGLQFLIYDSQDTLLERKRDRDSMPTKGLFFTYTFVSDEKNLTLETRIFRAISEDSTEFISKKQTEREMNGDQCTQYDLETAKTITKQFCFQKNGYPFLCSFWSTDKQLFKQKESLIDSIANTFYLNSW
jgi:hypothetical protein